MEVFGKRGEEDPAEMIFLSKRSRTQRRNEKERGWSANKAQVWDKTSRWHKKFYEAGKNEDLVISYCDKGIIKSWITSCKFLSVMHCDYINAH